MFTYTDVLALIGDAEYATFILCLYQDVLMMIMISSLFSIKELTFQFYFTDIRHRNKISDTNRDNQELDLALTGQGK